MFCRKWNNSETPSRKHEVATQYKPGAHHVNGEAWSMVQEHGKKRIFYSIHGGKKNSLRSITMVGPRKNVGGVDKTAGK